MSLEKEFKRYSEKNCKDCELECKGIRQTLDGVRCYEKDDKNRR